MKVEKVELPHNSLLANTNFDYADSYKSQNLADAENKIDLSAVGKAFFSSSPSWIDNLFALRNKLVSFIGLKTGEKVENKEEILKNFKGEIGEKVGLFQVFDKTENEIILGEDDKHLNFRVSLLIDTVNQTKKIITISTTVNFNNSFGKLYFLPVKPFHQIIVPTMLKATVKNLENEI